MSSSQYIPQNDLEMALSAGASDPAARPRFYETLLRSQVLIIPVGEVPPIADGVVVAETKMSLAAANIQGLPHIQFFSSELRLPAGSTFLGLSALDFLRLTKGSHLVLNPGSSYGKAFLPQEVDSLLDGSIFKPEKTVVAKAGTKQLIGQPKDYPHEFVAALSRYFSSEPSVERAFLAQHFIADMHTEPALLLAVIASEAGFDRIAGAVGVIAKETRKAQGAVDITRVQKDSLGYFANQTPIYTKKKSVLAKLFG